jgi:hypothetical protein
MKAVELLQLLLQQLEIIIPHGIFEGCAAWQSFEMKKKKEE